MSSMISITLSLAVILSPNSCDDIEYPRRKLFKLYRINTNIKYSIFLLMLFVSIVDRTTSGYELWVDPGGRGSGLGIFPIMEYATPLFV